MGNLANILRIILVCVCVVVGLAYPIHAQEGWIRQTACIGDLQQPRLAKNNWSFDGVIVTSTFNKGIIGVRGDIQTDYIIALESDATYTIPGVVSPDGQYFAYPIGEPTYNINTIGDELFGVDFVRIVRTDGQIQETYRFEAFEYSYKGVLYDLPSPRWIGTEKIYYPDLNEVKLVDFKSGEMMEWTAPRYLRLISPDGTRAFYDVKYGDPTTRVLYDITNNTEITDNMMYGEVVWFLDSSSVLATDTETLVMINREGEVLDTILAEPVRNIAIAPDKHAFAFRDDDFRLHIADFSTRTIYDLCIQSPEIDRNYQWLGYPNLGWSPDSRYIAWMQDHDLVIFDTVTFQNQVLDFQSDYVIGWYPLENYDNNLLLTPQADLAISPPTAIPVDNQATVTPLPILTTPTVELIEVTSCTLEVLVGTNLRAEPSATGEQVGSAGVGMQFTANLQAFNQTDFFTWWQLTSGGWVREDMVKEDTTCEFLPVKQSE